MFKANKTEAQVLALIEETQSHFDFLARHTSNPTALAENALDHLRFLVRHGGMRRVREKNVEVAIYEAQAREDALAACFSAFARADREGREPKYITSVDDIDDFENETVKASAEL
jgi:hypothetical protein